MALRLLTHPGTAHHMAHTNQTVHATNPNITVINSHLYLLEFFFKKPPNCAPFPLDAAEVGRAVLVAGRAGAGRGDPGPLPLPLQLCVWMRHNLGPGPALQIAQRYPANLLPLRCCQRQHQRASVARHSARTHNATTGKTSHSYFLKENVGTVAKPLLLTS